MMEIYTVGGAVRDKLLGLEPKDTDYVVVGATEDDMRALGYLKVGADFPVFLHPVTGDEYALARKERKVAAGYHGFDVDFSPRVTLEEDLRRRDLTINSMAMDKDGNIIDPYGGLEDLKNKIIRHTSEAFVEDPVRALRVARFAARYSDFTVAAETAQLIRDMAASGELSALVPERVYAEFAKGLMENSPVRMIDVLSDTLALGVISPKIMEEIAQNPNARDELQAVVDDQLSFSCRFVTIAKRFTKADFGSMSIPTNIRQLLVGLQHFMDVVVCDQVLPADAYVKLFNKLDVLRAPDRFEKILNIMASTGRVTGIHVDKRFMMQLAKAFNISNCEQIAAACEPQLIAHEIRAARLASLEQFLESCLGE